MYNHKTTILHIVKQGDDKEFSKPIQFSPNSKTDSILAKKPTIFAKFQNRLTLAKKKIQFFKKTLKNRFNSKKNLKKSDPIHFLSKNAGKSRFFLKK